VAQRHIVQRIGSDAVDGRDEGRLGGGDGMGVATNDGGGGDGGGSSTARRWFLAALPGTQDTPGVPTLHWTGRRPTLTMRRETCVHRVAMGGAVPVYLVTAHARTCQFHNLFALFYRLTDV
jgi:hypothetical protein